MDRLSALDVSFLTNESSSAHMHVGGICIFEGPPPSYDDLLDHVRSRLHLVPRFRQKLAYPPVPTGRPFWVDDPAFNLAYHVRHSALPSPGSEEQLRNMAARVFSQALDRTKPLWELWMVQGLTRKRFAFVTKTHHALVDGVSGVDIATVLFDVKPVPEPAEADDDWIPNPEPSGAQLLVKDAEAVAKAPLGALRRLEHAVESPRSAVARVSEAVEAVGEVGWNFANPAPDVPLNVKVGSHRRFEWVRADLAQFKRIKCDPRRHGQRCRPRGGHRRAAPAGCTAAACAPRAWSCAPRSRSRSAAPTSAASSATSSPSLRGPIPVYVEDPVKRLEICRKGMEGVKDSKQALGAEVISRFNDFAPPTLLAQAARVNFSTRLFNLVVTNVPGPQIPLYVLGRELEDIFPVGFLPPEQALFVAIMSYNGGINFGLLADYDALDDVAALADGIEGSIAELAEAADAAEREAGEREPATA